MSVHLRTEVAEMPRASANAVASKVYWGRQGGGIGGHSLGMDLLRSLITPLTFKVTMFTPVRIVLVLWLVFTRLSCAVDTASSSSKSPQYQHLPPLREQAEIYDGWRKERLDRVPEILQKYGVDAWIV